MIDNQKDIDEMAKIIALYVPINCDSTRIAKALVNSGYGNVNEAISDFVVRLLKGDI